MSAKRVLVSGDIDGDLERVYTDVVKQEAVHGKFDLLFAVGKFLPANQTKGSGLHAYVSGEKQAPIKTYFIDSASGIFCSSASQGRTLGKTSIEYMGAFGVKEIEGLKVGFLSGRQPPPERYDEEHFFDDGRPKHSAEGFYTRSVVEAMKSLEGPIDLLLTSEWPADMNTHIDKERGDQFEPAADLGATSAAVAEIAAALEPRFHIFGLANKFYRRQPYQAKSGHVCRPIGLGRVGEKGKDRKALHALIIVPFAQCKQDGLTRGIEDATSCPYTDTSNEIGKKRKLLLPSKPPPKMVKLEIAPPGHHLRQAGSKWVLDINLGEGRSFTIETGEVARKADGSVMMCAGGTRVLCSACAQRTPKDSLSLSIDYRERSSAAGKTPGGFFKRDNPQLADYELLVCRLTDRPLRPTFLDAWNFETQILQYVMSYDEVHLPEPLALCGAFAAVCLSDIPTKQTIGAVMVVLTPEDKYVVNPTLEERNASKMRLVCAGTADAVTMVEAQAQFVSEKQFLNGVHVAHDAIKIICAALSAFAERAGKTKRTVVDSQIPRQLPAIVERKYAKKIDKVFRADSSTCELLSELEVDAVEQLGPAKDGEEKALEFEAKDISKAFMKLASQRLFALIKETGARADGRDPKDVRTMDIAQRYLPNPHGTCLFTRGHTQTIATCTLGDSGAQQRVESIVDAHKKKFYLQYTFPPFTASLPNKSALDMSHGDLAERALLPSIPEYDDFPYTIRSESFVTESNASSMASVCGCSLAMIDAGVPLKSVVAGVDMGVIGTIAPAEDGEDAGVVILTDTAELEEYVGTVRLKVAGNTEGFSAVQLDVENEGVSDTLLGHVLSEAMEALQHIVIKMEKVIPEGKRDLPANVPKLLRFKVPLDIKGKLIGPGGSNLRKMITEFNLKNIFLDEDGGVEISSLDEAVNNTVKMIIDDITNAAPDFRRRAPIDQPRLTMEIPMAAKGKVIGRGGAIVHALVEEFSLQDIKVLEDGKVELIGGVEGNRIACKEKIDTIVAPQNNLGPLPDDVVHVAKSIIGKLIGKAGSNIRQLITDYGLNDIKVRSTEDSGTVEIFGGHANNRELLRSYLDELSTNEASAFDASEAQDPSDDRPLEMRDADGDSDRIRRGLKNNSAVGILAGMKLADSEGRNAITSSSRQGEPDANSTNATTYREQIQMELAGLCPGDDTTYYSLLPFQRQIIRKEAAAFQLSCERDARGDLVVRRPEDS